jgi:PST family polysaccharide transporter
MFLGTGLLSVLQMLVLIILSRLLTPTDYGVMGAASIVLGISAIFCQMGVGPAIVQHPSLEQRHIRTGFTISMLFGILLTGIIWAIAPGVAVFFQMDSMTPVLRILSFVFLLQGASAIPLSLLERKLKFRSIAIIEVLSYAGYGIVGVSLAAMNFGIWALVFAQLSWALLNCCMLIIVQPYPKLPKFENLAFKELVRFGSAVTVANIFNYFARCGDYLVVGRWIGSEALGLYGRAYKLMTLPATIFGSVADRVLFPAIAKVQNKPKHVVIAYRRSLAAIALLTLPMSAIMIVLAPELITLILGPKWIDAVIPFQILTVGAYFRTSYKISEATARAMGAVHKIARIQGAYAILVLSGAWFGRCWGISGVAFGVLLALGMTFTFLTRLTVSLTSMSWKVFLSVHLPAIRLTVILFAELWLIANILRYFDWPSISILILASLLIGVNMVIVSCLKLLPLLGEDGVWVLNIFIEKWRHKLDTFDWLKKQSKDGINDRG